PACFHWFAAILRSLMSCGIHPLTERRNADAAHGVEELLAILAPGDIDIEDARNGFSNGILGNGRADDLAQRACAADRAAERDLIPLDAMLVDAEDADVAHVMKSAGIHAA